MKYTAVLALIASTQAIQLEYNDFFTTPPPIWDVIKRGDARDFADENVKAAMKANPTSGEWPVPVVPKQPQKPEKDGEHWEKQPWEQVVKKGNSEFSDKQVAKAQALKPEVIAIGGKAIPAGGVKGDAEGAAAKAEEKKDDAAAEKASTVPDQTVKP